MSTRVLQDHLRKGDSDSGLRNNFEQQLQLTRLLGLTFLFPVNWSPIILILSPVLKSL